METLINVKAATESPEPSGCPSALAPQEIVKVPGMDCDRLRLYNLGVLALSSREQALLAAQ